MFDWPEIKSSSYYLIAILCVFLCLSCYHRQQIQTAKKSDNIIIKKDKKKADFIVAKDGSGDFKTVQEAINAVPDMQKARTIIYIKNDVYKEKLILPANKTNVKLLGESLSGVVLTYDDYASKKNSRGENIGTTGSSSFFVYGDGFIAENITFENSSGPVGQAVAVRVSADKIKFVNCRFLGFQDTLYPQANASKGRQYFQNCYVEGTTDFIFGAAAAVFEDCIIYCKKGGQYITAANTPAGALFGFVFLRCTIKGDEGVQYYLGRPWGNDAKTVFLYCFLPAFITPQGWHNWSKPDAEKTTFYAEYKNKGAGAASHGRVSWSHQLTDRLASEYTLANIFKDWDVSVE